MKIIQIIMECLNVINCFKSKITFVVKLFLYANKVNFNAKSIIEVVLPCFSIRWLKFPFQASND